MRKFEISNQDPMKMEMEDLISELEQISAFMVKGLFEMFFLGISEPEKLTENKLEKHYQDLDERSDLLFNEFLRRRIP